LKAEYQISRDQQKLRVAREIQELEFMELDDEAKLQEYNTQKVFFVKKFSLIYFFSLLFRFWNMKSENCPEIRCQIAQKSRRNEETRVNNVDDETKLKRKPKMFSESGRPYCLNFAKLNFNLLDESDRYELNLHVYR
jgi:hypothetical protein